MGVVGSSVVATGAVSLAAQPTSTIRRRGRFVMRYA
jgi:hypothetical protein